jgi:chemotaxis protein CheX
VNVEFINPFIESVHSVFKTMLDTEAERQQLRIGSEASDESPHVVTSLIGISGKASGVVALRFPRRTAIELARRFLTSDVTSVNEEVIDALAELANMVGGSAKAQFNIDPPPTLSLPIVVEGGNYKSRCPTQSVWVEVPFSSTAGEFSMEVSFHSS